MTDHPHFIPGHVVEWRPSDPRPAPPTLWDMPGFRHAMAVELDKIRAEQVAKYTTHYPKIRSVSLIPIEKAQPGCEVYIPHRFRGGL